MLKKLSALALLIAVGTAFGATRTYQVTGPVLEVTNDYIVVQKGKEKWEIARDALTKMQGTPKVGDKVTIEYRMAAAAVETKGDKTKKK